MRQTQTQTLLASLAGLGLLASVAVSAAAPASPQGFITAKEYRGAAGVTVNDLVAMPNYPNNPDLVVYPVHFEWPTGADGNSPTDTSAPPGSVRDNYGVEIEGYVYAPTSGTYYFAIAADDGADLWLSTDDSPANAVQIAAEPVWSGVRMFAEANDRRTTVDAGTADERLVNQSRGIALQANKPYYIRARMKEGGGGDNLAVTWNTTGPTGFLDGDAPIPGAHLSSIDISDVNLPFFGALAGQANGFDWAVSDGQTRTVASATAKLNGATVPVTVVTRGGNKFVSYRITEVANFLASGSTHEVELVLTDSAGGTQTRTAEFTVAAYATVPASYKASSASTRGMNWYLYQTEIARPGANAVWAADNALAGGVIDPNTGTTAENIADTFGSVNGIFPIDIINFEQNGGDVDPANPANGPDRFNSVLPSINDARPNGFTPGQGFFSTDNMVAETTGYIELPAGMNTLVVNSDDGFRFSIFSGTGDVLGLVIGQFDGGRGASDTVMDFVVAEAGLYPFRLTWWEGGGGANVEFFSVNRETGQRILVNDPAVPAAIKTFRTGTGTAVVRSVLPAAGANTGDPAQPLKITLENGSTTVTTSSIKVKVNGEDAAVTTQTSGTQIIATATPATQPGFDSLVTVDLEYATSGGATRTATYTYRTRGFSPADLPPYTEGSFVIEAEDFNYDGGQSVAAANTMPYLNGAYDGLGGIEGIDFNNNDGPDSDLYRTETDSTGAHQVNMDLATGGRYAIARPGYEVTTNYKIGWVEGGSWQNYTRTIPAGFYNVYAALSYDGTAAGQLSASLALVTSDATQPDQTTQVLGTFTGPGSGGWGQNNLVAMADGAGNRAVWKAPGGPVTLRFNLGSGDFDWFVLTPASSVPPIVRSFSPVAHDVVGTSPEVVAELQDGTSPVAGVKVFFNGTEVTSSANITKAGDITTVRYAPAGPVPHGTAHSYRIEYTGGSINVDPFFVTPLGSEGLFLVEAEDWDYDGGQSKPEASVMPYTGGAYAELGAVLGVDYASNDGDDSRVYRTLGTQNKQINANDAFNGVDLRGRGTWEVTANYKLGWADTADWLNYTRNIPQGEYQVWAGLSYDGRDANQLRATLGQVTAGAGTATQTVTPIGSFNGPGSGGWGNTRLVPMRDSSGAFTKVNLSGNTVLRFTMDSGDYDYFVLQKVGEGNGGGGGGVIGVSRGEDGSITLTYEGTLLGSETLNGTYAPVGGASSPYTVTPSGGARFFKLQ